MTAKTTGALADRSWVSDSRAEMGKGAVSTLSLARESSVPPPSRPTETTEPRRGLRALDARLTEAPGLVVVRTTRNSVAAVSSYLERRFQLLGYAPVQATYVEGLPAFEQLARRLGLQAYASNAGQLAAQLAAPSLSTPRALVLTHVVPGSWDESVALEIGNWGSWCVLVGEAVTSDEAIVVDDALDAYDRVHWFDSLAKSQEALPFHRIDELEAWWQSAKRTAAAAPDSESLSHEAASALAALATVGGLWPLTHVARLGLTTQVIDELNRRGAIANQDDIVVLDSRWLAVASNASALLGLEEKKRLAQNILEGPGEPVPWLALRAAELLVEAGEWLSAEKTYHEAVVKLGEVSLRREAARRWATLIERAPTEARRTMQVHAAERAVQDGDAEEAFAWANAAAVSAPDDPQVSLLVARAALRKGDLIVARVALEKGLARTTDPLLVSAMRAELGELGYLLGDFEMARSQAAVVLAGSCSTNVRLAARNTIGKVLLAESRWDDAEIHFAEDAWSAAIAKDVEAELRAKLNRGIATFSRGDLQQSRMVFQDVLARGEAMNHFRACAYALRCLALVKMQERNYGEALELWERTFAIPNTVRDHSINDLANLAELRIKLGLLDHAEHALSFGRRMLQPGARAIYGARLSLVAARIAMARGNTFDARREVTSVLGDTRLVQEVIDEGQRLLTRIALEDGDVAAAQQAVEAASVAAKKPAAKTEVALLRALIARASGAPALDLAIEAWKLARESDEDEVLREVHTLLFTLHREAGQSSVAATHLQRAIALRDQVAASLPADIRSVFLARPEIVSLSRMQGVLSEVIVRSDKPAARVHHQERELIGEDPSIRGLKLIIRRVANSDTPVLIHGESGTGKELVAEALHRASLRASGPLVTVNCAALVETLLLSELFGHEKGAFTGAFSKRRGRFELAEGGTLFLDEIGDISPRTQVALLRVLQERTFERVGGSAPIKTDARIICATHRDLRAMVERGEFREDLYYRLRGVTLEVPALRARMGDLPAICDHILDRIAVERGEPKKSLSRESIDLLCRHRWPGNVRELENTLRSTSLFSDNDVITVSDIVSNVDELRSVAAQSCVSAPATRPSMPRIVLEETADDDEESAPLPGGEFEATAIAYGQIKQGATTLADMKRQIERDCIARALAETKGNITRAAALLGMKRPRLSQLVKQYGLSVVSSEGL